MSTPKNARVKKHRAKLAAEGCGRMEVTLRRTFIKQIREIARQKQWPFWLFVERALIAYATNTDESGNGE
jgi:hypothetical protein